MEVVAQRGREENPEVKTTYDFLLGKWKFILFGVIYVISCILFVSYLYGQAKKSIDTEINSRLYSGALVTVAALGDHYHDHLVDKHSKTTQQDWDTIQRLTQFSHQLNLTYLYTVIERDGQAILISSSASDDELKNNTYVRFFDPYPDASHQLLTALHEHRVIWTDYTDHWGKFRAVFIPMHSADGTSYIAGAEVSMENYRIQLHGQELHFVGFSIFLFIGFNAFVIVYSYLNHLRHRFTQLRLSALELKKSREIAESANQAKSRFVAVMSHELRTPLNGILGATELLAETSLEASQREYLHIVHSSGQSLLTMVNEVLDLSKIESEQETLELSDFAIEPFIQSILSLIRPQLSSPSVHLGYRIANNIPAYLRADANKLRRVLINLLGNAAKFTDAGQIQLTIRLIDRKPAMAAGEVRLRFEVRDSGIGIAPESQHQLFKPFSQIRSQQGREASGSGLGLSISRHLVCMMGGDLTVTSQLEQGATFAFDIVCQSVEQFALSELEAAHSEGVENRRPWHILVVDDSAVNRSLAKLMLERLGHTVETLDCGEEVLQTIRNTHYDIILMDIHMGEVNGIEATCSIRRESRFKQPYIIAYTANAYVEDIEEYRACGMNDVLVKPVQFKDIKKVLTKARDYFESTEEHL